MTTLTPDELDRRIAWLTVGLWLTRLVWVANILYGWYDAIQVLRHVYSVSYGISVTARILFFVVLLIPPHTILSHKRNTLKFARGDAS